MKGVDFPPEEEDYTADPVELFFDLAFVFAFSRLVYHLVHHPDAEGFFQFVVIMTLIWIGWSQFTWSANAVPGNQRPIRALFLVGTVASIPMAASVTTAFGDGGLLGFAFSWFRPQCFDLRFQRFDLDRIGRACGLKLIAPVNQRSTQTLETFVRETVVFDIRFNRTGEQIETVKVRRVLSPDRGYGQPNCQKT